MQWRWHRDARRSWLRPIVLWVAAPLVACALVYLIAANVILRTGALSHWVTGASEGLLLEIESGWTVWPGRVHVKGVELHFEDYNIQFSVTLDEATVDIALWQLPAKIFHLTRVRGSGVRYLLRHKVASAEGHERRLALYPKIAGYSDPPLFVGPPLPPLTDEQYDLWTIHLEDVDVTAEVLWFLEYRFEGKARAKGGFRIEPERDAQTERCSLTLDGTLQVGAQTVASKLDGWLHAQLDRHDPRRVQGAQIFPKLSVNTELDIVLANLEFTELYRSPGGVELGRGAGPVHVRAQLEHGEWMENTALRYDTNDISVAQERMALVGPLLLTAGVTKGGHDSLVELVVRSPRLRLGAHGAPKGIASPFAREVQLSVGMSADLARPIEPRSMRARLALEVPELSWLDTMLESRQLFTHGSARAHVAVRWSKGKLGGGTLALEAKQARFALAGNVLQLSGTADAQLSYDEKTQRGQVNELLIELPHVAVSHKQDWKGLPGGLRARAERLTWQGEPPRGVQGRFTLDAKDIDPFVPFVISSPLLRSIAKALVDTGDAHAVVELDRTPAALELRLEELQSGDLRVYGILRSERDTKDPCGRFFVYDPKFGVGVELHRGETSIDLFVSPKWWRERAPTTTCGPGFERPKAKPKAKPKPSRGLPQPRA